jgi:hypothetical protein
MTTILLKPASSPLAAYLAANPGAPFVDVYTFELVDGTDERYRLRYTSGQKDLTVVPLTGGLAVTYRAGAIIKGVRSKAAIGMEVAEQTMEITFPAGETIQSMDATEAIIWGLLDGAFLRRDRWFYDARYGAPVGGLPMFYGEVSTFQEVAGSYVKLRVKSGNVRLNQQMPRHLSDPLCKNVVYDAGCGLDRNAFAAHGSVEPGATTTVIPWAAGSSDTYSLGRVFFDNMGLVGTWRQVKSADASGFTLAYPLPQAPGTGDLFTIYPGCNRTHDRCVIINPDVSTRFRGYRFVPQSEKAV